MSQSEASTSPSESSGRGIGTGDSGSATSAQNQIERAIRIPLLNRTHMFMRDGQGTDEGLGSNTQGAPTIGEASTSYARSRDQGRGMRDCRAATSAENQIQMGRRLTRLTPSAAIHRVAKEETRGWGPNIDFTRPLRHCPQFRAGNLQLHVLLVKLRSLFLTYSIEQPSNQNTQAAAEVEGAANV